MYQAIRLKSGRDKPMRQRHPWIFSGAIAETPESIADGEIVSVLDASGDWLALGHFNRASQIRVRILTWDPQNRIDDAFWYGRLAHAIERRRALAHVRGAGFDETDSGATNAWRLANAENDYLPGLVVDRYDRHLVMQVGTLGMEQQKETLAAMLLDLTGCASVIERSDIAARRMEGLPETEGLLRGAAPPDTVHVREAGLRFAVDLWGGQKTGFYLDQRANRQRVAAYCHDKRVLNAFSYTGAFAVHALAAGAAHVTNVDTSIDALEIGEENLRRNGFDPDTQSVSIAGDVFEVLRDWRDFGVSDVPFGVPSSDAGTENGDGFDLIILDPPKFAQSKRHVERALRGYKDINLLAMNLLRPNGILATCSCSGLVGVELFQKVVFGAAVDAGRDVQILEWLYQAADPPVAPTFPEGAYLKGLLCRVM